jgi:hypothetical protein
MNTDGTGFYTCKESHKTESLWNHITTDHKEGEQLEDRRNAGESSCNSGDGTDQRVQSLIFMMMTVQGQTTECLMNNELYGCSRKTSWPNVKHTCGTCFVKYLEKLARAIGLRTDIWNWTYRKCSNRTVYRTMVLGGPSFCTGRETGNHST